MPEKEKLFLSDDVKKQITEVAGKAFLKTAIVSREASYDDKKFDMAVGIAYELLPIPVKLFVKKDCLKEIMIDLREQMFGLGEITKEENVVRNRTNVPVVNPVSAEDCKDFIRKNREKILKRVYDVNIEPEWVKSLSASDIQTLVSSCPSALKTLASSEDTPVEYLEVLSRFSLSNEHVKTDTTGSKFLSSLPLLGVVNMVYDTFKDYNEDPARVREAVAANKKTPQSVLERLSRDGDNSVRLSVAKNPNVPIDTLELLARDQDNNVACESIINPKMPVKVLDVLKSSKRTEIRESIAAHPNSTAEILYSLVSDQDINVKIAVASHQNTSADSFKELLLDTDSPIQVVLAVVYNPKSKEIDQQGLTLRLIEEIESPSHKEGGLLKSLLKKDWRPACLEILMNIAHSETTQPDLLDLLAHSGVISAYEASSGIYIETVKKRVAANLNTPPETLKKIGEKKSIPHLGLAHLNADIKTASEIAKENPNYPKKKKWFW